MSFSDEVTEQLRRAYHERFRNEVGRCASERQAAEIRKSAGVTDPLFCDSTGAPGHRKPGYEWTDQACDESGLPVAAVPEECPPCHPIAQYREPGELERRVAWEEAHGGGQYVTKDSGQRDVFESGCQRDLGEGKGAYDLMPVRPLRRLAQLYERGAKKYNDHNWRRGMPFGRVIQSMIRHAEQFKEGDESEDHLAAVAWNAFTLMEYCEAISAGDLPPELDNRFRYPEHPPGL